MNGPAGMAMPGGPVGVPVGSQPPTPSLEEQLLSNLNTYIYDHFLKTKQFDLARQFRNQNHVKIKDSKPNGVSMAVDSKDAVKKPDDLPDPDCPPTFGENSFLFDWFCMFWDTYHSARRNSSVYRQPTNDYVAQQRTKPNMFNPADAKLIRIPAIPNVKGMQPRNAVQVQEMMTRKMVPNGGIQRDVTAMEMAGHRPNTPGAMDNAPSPPKKPKLENGHGFEGQHMVANGRPMVSPAVSGMMPNGLAEMQATAAAAYANGHAGTPKFEGMNGLPGHMSQAVENIDYNNRVNTPNQGTDGRHALQNYQIQLMLLEQQNKKRLLQARREQDLGVSGSFIYTPHMSPTNSRIDAMSPTPEQVRRGTPKLSQPNLSGSPAPDMQQRNSPGAPNFDPSTGQPPNLAAQQYYGQLQGMARPPSSHPNFQNGMNGVVGGQQQQLQDMVRVNQGTATKITNTGNWPPTPGSAMPNNPNNATGPGAAGTPQPRPGIMAPPPASDNQQMPQRNESSPAQPPAPPTPSQNGKGNTKKKEPGTKKKNGPKKQASTTAVAPPAQNGISAAESVDPIVSAPSTPMTPMPGTTTGPVVGRPPSGVNPLPNNPLPNNGLPNTSLPNNALPNNQPQTQGPPVPVPMPVLDQSNPVFPHNVTDDPPFSLDFADMNSNDVLEHFDFDSFLTVEDQNFNLGDMPFGDNSVEAGAGNV